MESTGVYWIPAYEVLEGHGFQVILVNARYAKNFPGRKTDVNDATWLQRLHSYGLLRGSFRPKAGVATLRAYLRQRERLIEYSASHIQHMQKALMEMNVQLQHVVSDITGVTGMRIIRAIVAGERDPASLAQMRDIRCHANAETICAALTGTWKDEHLFALGQLLALFDFYQTKITECDHHRSERHRVGCILSPAVGPGRQSQSRHRHSTQDCSPVLQQPAARNGIS